jgi:KUP system potassium uptake protein
LLDELKAGRIARVPGTAAFLTGNPAAVPTALSQHLRHCPVLHERVIILNLRARDVAHLPVTERVTVEPLGAGVYRVLASHGFMDDVGVPVVLAAMAEQGVAVDPAHISFYLRRQIILATPRPGMAIWRERLYAWIVRNATNAVAFFHLPPDRVVEVGAHVEI